MLNRADAHHATCLELFASLPERPLVPVTVLVEVCWLLEGHPDIEATFLDAVASGAFALIAVIAGAAARMAELVRQYADFPLGAVDASVVALAERLNVVQVATLDRDFTVIRPRRVDAFTILPE